MNASLNLFLEYIDNLDQDQRIREPGASVADAFRDAGASLIELKESAQSYLVPGKDSRGRWVPVFDEDRTNDVANLASQISQTKDKIESISNDINEIVVIGDGPGHFGLLDQLQEARRSLRNAQNHAANLSQRAIAKNPGLSLDKIANLSGVAEAYLDLSEVEATAPAKIAALEAKVAQRRTIYSRYGVD
jgi:hypothetical protein